MIVHHDHLLDLCLFSYLQTNPAVSLQTTLRRHLCHVNHYQIYLDGYVALNYLWRNSFASSFQGSAVSSGHHGGCLGCVHLYGLVLGWDLQEVLEAEVHEQV